MYVLLLILKYKKKKRKEIKMKERVIGVMEENILIGDC